jgi:hypothetical protein
MFTHSKLWITNIPSNFPIPHIFEPLSSIPQWNMRVDNFIESIVVFAIDFYMIGGANIIMYTYDPCVLKEIRSFLESYQLKVHMKWIVVNSSTPKWIARIHVLKYQWTHYIHLFSHFTLF